MGRFTTDPKRNAPNPNQQAAPNPVMQHAPYGQAQPVQEMPEWPTEFPKPAIVIDVEGVVVEAKDFKLRDTSDLKYNIENIQALRTLRLNGHKVTLLAGFPEISKGTMSPQDGENIIKDVMREFGQNGILTIDHTLFAGSDLKDDEFAIPNPGMLRRLKNEFNYDLSGAMYVGDNIKVLKAAAKFGIRPVLLKSSRFEETEKKLNTHANKELKKKTKIIDSLEDLVGA